MNCKKIIQNNMNKNNKNKIKFMNNFSIKKIFQIWYKLLKNKRLKTQAYLQSYKIPMN